MIQGYVTPSSISAGSKITIHAGAVDDTDRTKPGTSVNFRAYFFRRGANWDFQGKSDVWTASPVEPPEAPGAPASAGYTEGDAASDWNWPGFDFVIPQGWPSGVYVAVFVKDEGRPVRQPNPDDAKYYYSRTLFVIYVAQDEAGT